MRSKDLILTITRIGITIPFVSSLATNGKSDSIEQETCYHVYYSIFSLLYTRTIVIQLFIITMTRKHKTAFCVD